MRSASMILRKLLSAPVAFLCLAAAAPSIAAQTAAPSKSVPASV
jgi:hypothetical protein